MSMCISIAEARRNRVSRRSLFRRYRFTSAPCSFFEPMCISCARHGTSGTCWGLKRRFALTGAGHCALFHPCGRRGPLRTLLKRWQAWVTIRGAFGCNFSQRAQFLVNGWRFARVENLDLWRGRIWFGTRRWFRVAGATLRMHRAHFSWQAQYFVDLDKKGGWELRKTSNKGKRTDSQAFFPKQCVHTEGFLR